MIFNWVPLDRLFEDSSRFSHLIVLHRTAHDKDIKGANGRPLDCLLQLILLLLFLSDRRSCRFLGQVVIAGLRDVWRVTWHRLHPGAFSCWLVACVSEFFIVLRTSGWSRDWYIRQACHCVLWVGHFGTTQLLLWCAFQLSLAWWIFWALRMGFATCTFVSLFYTWVWGRESGMFGSWYLTQRVQAVKAILSESAHRRLAYRMSLFCASLKCNRCLIKRKLFSINHLVCIVDRGWAWQNWHHISHRKWALLDIDRVQVLYKAQLLDS